MRGPSSRPRGFRAAYALARSTLALAVLAVFGGSHALPALHFATIAHELCAEHGVLHHAGPTETDHEHAVDAEGPAFAPGNAADHEHEHCGSPATSTPRAARLGASETLLLELSPSAVQVPVDRSAAKSSVAVLSYAPKLAPPV